VVYARLERACRWSLLRCCHNALNDQIHRGGRTEQSRWDSDICVGDFVIYYTDVVGDDIHYLSRGERREANDA
jgi:hypothetical protein